MGAESTTLGEAGVALTGFPQEKLRSCYWNP